MCDPTGYKGSSELIDIKKLSKEPISKRFSLVKVKAGEYFNRKNTLSILRIEI